VSGTVRILALAFGAAAGTVLYLGLGFAWYVAILVGIAVLIAFPMCNEFVARLRGRARLKLIVKDAQDRSGSS